MNSKEEITERERKKLECDQTSLEQRQKSGISETGQGLKFVVGGRRRDKKREKKWEGKEHREGRATTHTSGNNKGEREREREEEREGGTEGNSSANKREQNDGSNLPDGKLHKFNIKFII